MSNSKKNFFFQTLNFFPPFFETSKNCISTLNVSYFEVSFYKPNLLTVNLGSAIEKN